jgi:hypothetical protein
MEAIIAKFPLTSHGVCSIFGVAVEPASTFSNIFVRHANYLNEFYDNK